MPKISEIKLTVHLDDNRVPEKIEWEATDSGFEGKKECKSLMLSLWDKEENVTLGIDLWTKEMTVDEMNIYVHQSLLKMADTYRRATKNSVAADLIENFSAEFAEKLDLKKK
jgi:gliding motility-associated protein GldC